MQSVRPTLILASGSASRRQMLAAAGVTFEVVPSSVDEAAIKRRLAIEGVGTSPLVLTDTVAMRLAEAKALDVGARRPAAHVIGADQTLAVLRPGEGPLWLDKPTGLAGAREQLRSMRGRTHVLTSAVALVRDGTTVWQHVDVAHMTMRDFSDAFLDDYLARAGAKVTSSVGAYQLEGLGIQLFERIEGDYFTILGMPLLPLLAALRGEGLLPA